MAPDFNINTGENDNDAQQDAPNQVEDKLKEEESDKEEEDKEKQKEGNTDEGNGDENPEDENNEDSSDDENIQNQDEQLNEMNAAEKQAIQEEQQAIGGQGIGHMDTSQIPDAKPPAQRAPKRSNSGPISIPEGAVAPASDVKVPENGPTINDFKSEVNAKTSEVKAEEATAPEEANSELESKGTELKTSREGKTEGYQADLEEKLPDSPELEEEPEAKEDGIRTEAEAIIQPWIDKKLPNQSMPALNPTPSGIMPRIGDSMEIIAFENEMQNLENQIAAQSADKKFGVNLDELSSNQEKLEMMQQALDTVLPPVEGEAAQVELVDEGEPPSIPIPEEMKAEMGDVVANLLSDTTGKATEMVDTIRKKAYAGEGLHAAYPDMGVDQIPSLAAALEKDLTAIAEEAGISAEELAKKVQEQKEGITEEEEAALADLESNKAEQEGHLKTQSEEEQSKITEVKKAADDQALKQMEAAQGENDPEVIKQKAASIKEDISVTIGKQKVAYDQALKRRHTKFDKSKRDYENAYKMAAVREKNTLNNSGENESEESNKPNLEIAKIDNWEDNQLRQLSRDVLQLKAKAKTTVDSYKSQLAAAGKTVKDKVNSWEETETNKQKSWWQRLIDTFTDFFNESKAESEAWEQINAKESVEALGQNIDFLTRAKEQLGEDISAESIDRIQGITEEQREILKAYYGSGPEAGNSIAAVGKGLLSKITNEHSPQMTKKFTKELEGKPYTEWDKLEMIAKRINPSFSAGHRVKELYAAMKGGIFGAGTDEDRVYAALAGLSPFEVLVVKHLYQYDYGASLEAHIKDEFSGSEEDRALALMESNAVKADAAALHEAMKGGLTGWGTDEDAIMKALRGKTEEERLQLINYYKTEYGRDLTADLEDELGGHDLDRADALMDGDTAKADAIAIDDAMHGGLFGWGTDEDAIESVYSDIRNDAESDAKKKSAQIQAMAASQGWSSEQLNKALKDAGVDSEGIERDVLKRNAQTEQAFNTEYGSDYDTKDGESALRLAFESEMEGPELDLANALADNDQTAADAARLADEFNNSWFYASDNATNDILENQYDRALKDLKTDELPAMHMEIDRMAKEQGWDRYRVAEEKRKAEASLEQKARTNSMELMNQLETTYDSKYSGDQYSYLDGHRNSGGLRSDLQRYTQGSGEDKAMDLLDQGGYLSPVQRIEYATEGLGTDEDELKKVFEGKTQEEIKAIELAWSQEHSNTLTDQVKGDLSGRDEFDTLMSMRGLPKDIHEDMQNIRDRYQFEEDNQTGAKIFAYGTSTLLLGPMGGMASGDYLYDNVFGGNEAAILKDRLDRLERNYAIVNDPNANAADKKLADEMFGNGTTNFTAAVEASREQMDAVANGVASAVAITAAVVVGAVLTALSGGTAAPGVAAAIGSIASALGTTSAAVIAGASALSAAAATVVTKKVLLGGAYGDEAILMDMGIGIVDAGVSIATFGVGGRVLQGLRLGAFAEADQAIAKRIIAMAITEYSEGAISSIPSGLLTELLNDDNFRDGDAIGRILRNVANNANMSGGMGVGMGGLGMVKDSFSASTADANTSSTTQDIHNGSEVDFESDVDIPTPTGNASDIDPPQNGSVVSEPVNSDINNLQDGQSTPYEDLSPSAQRARNKGYPDAPADYSWNSSDGENLILQRKPGKAQTHTEIKYDPDTGKFVDKNTGTTFDTAAEVVAFNQAKNRPSGGNGSGNGGLDAEGFRIEAENAVANSKKIEDVSITPDGLEELKNHLRQPFFTDQVSTGVWDHNEIMIDRLEKILAGDLEPTLTDLHFFAHETGEAKIMSDLMANNPDMSIGEAYQEAHAIISKEYGVIGKSEQTTFYTQEALDAADAQALREAEIDMNAGRDVNRGSSGGDDTGSSDPKYSGRPAVPPGYEYVPNADGTSFTLKKRVDDPNIPDIELSEDGQSFVLSSNKEVTFASAEEVTLYRETLKYKSPSGDTVTTMDKSKRPDVDTYLTQEQIDEHLALFQEEGVSCLAFSNAFDDYGQIGRNDGQFVLTKADMDALMARTGGDIEKIQIELGIPDDIWLDKVTDPTRNLKLIRVDVTDPSAIDLRMATGREAGANALWVPGGKTLGGVNEAVVNPIKPDIALVTPTNLDDMVVNIQERSPNLHSEFVNLEPGIQNQFFKDFVNNPKGYQDMLDNPQMLQAWNDMYELSFYSGTKTGHDIRNNTDFLLKYSALAPEDQVKLKDYILKLKAPKGRKGQVDFYETRQVAGLGEVTIHYDKNGFPNFVDYCPQPIEQFRVISDNLRGTAADFKLANEQLAQKFGFEKPYQKDTNGNYLPLEKDGYKWIPGKNNFEYNGIKYTWHHHQDGRNLFPVETRVHSTTELGSPGYPHSGGDKLIKLGLKGFFDGPDFE